MSAAARSTLVLGGCGSSGPPPSRVSACASQVKISRTHNNKILWV